MDVINFYSVSDHPYGEFSNFASFPIRLGGETWPASEHYFQAQKFEDEAYRKKIRTTASPMIAARLGRSRKVKIRRDWESVKVGVMRDAVRAKFSQHDELSELLLATGDAKLVEHTSNDSYWGDGGDGSGKHARPHPDGSTRRTPPRLFNSFTLRPRLPPGTKLNARLLPLRVRR